MDPWKITNLPSHHLNAQCVSLGIVFTGYRYSYGMDPSSKLYMLWQNFGPGSSRVKTSIRGLQSGNGSRHSAQLQRLDIIVVRFVAQIYPV